ncbi:MAG: hypothetical protein MH204_12315 [Fimbriimonadaceae bacterium]|nr:hypothetical protein [Fimbriimonadaceae bacterium]
MRRLQSLVGMAIAGVLLTLAVGCGGGEPKAADPAAPPAAAPEASASGTPVVPAMGAMTGTRGDVRLTVELNAGGEARWAESEGEKSREWSGKWRREEDMLLLLLEPETEGAPPLNVVLRLEEGVWKASEWDGQKLPEDGEVVLQPEA